MEGEEEGKEGRERDYQIARHVSCGSERNILSSFPDIRVTQMKIDYKDTQRPLDKFCQW
jgi:hypothetical protein